MPDSLVMPAFALLFVVLATSWFVILYKTNVKCPEAANLSNILSFLAIAAFLGFVSMFVVGALFTTLGYASGLIR